MNLNLEDIARISGFSRSTVSRVINEQPYVHELTRQKILRVIEQYEFQPNPTARALVSQKLNVVGVLIPQVVDDLFNDPFMSLLLQAIAPAANRRGYSVSLWLEASHISEKEFYRKALRHRLVGGWIIASASMDMLFLENLGKHEVPYVLVGTPRITNQDIQYVDAENKRGAKLMVQHLLTRGYQRIGMIRGRKGLLSSQHRYEGYVEALQAAGYPINPHFITPPNDYTEIAGYFGMRQLLAAGVDAVFAASDVIAAGALRAVHEAGLNVPEDIAIGGFDDLPLALKVTPSLTTIRQPVHQMGAAAVEGLIAQLEDKHDAFSQRVFPVELVIRAST